MLEMMDRDNLTAGLISVVVTCAELPVENSVRALPRSNSIVAPFHVFRPFVSYIVVHSNIGKQKASIADTRKIMKNMFRLFGLNYIKRTRAI